MVADTQMNVDWMNPIPLSYRQTFLPGAGGMLAGDTSWKPMEIPPDCEEMGYYVGTSGYYFDDWIGRFNPPKASKPAMRNMTHYDRADQDRLLFYQKYFPLVEVNNTFYREPALDQFVDINTRSRSRTQYIVKVHRDISHSRSQDADQARSIMRRYVSSVAPLRESGRFFSFLIQLEDHLRFSARCLDYLRSVALEATHSDLDVHIEFRHISWHSVQAFQALKDAGIGICNTEIPPVRHAFPLKYYATTDKGYVRYSGRNLDNWYPSGPQTTSKERTDARNARYDYLYSEDEVGDRVLGQISLRQKTSSVVVAYNNHYNAQAAMNGIMNLKILSSLVTESREPLATGVAN